MNTYLLFTNYSVAEGLCTWICSKRTTFCNYVPSYFVFSCILVVSALITCVHCRRCVKARCCWTELWSSVIRKPSSR